MASHGFCSNFMISWRLLGGSSAFHRLAAPLVSESDGLARGFEWALFGQGRYSLHVIPCFGGLPSLGGATKKSLLSWF
ncbi:uncharacterized protein P884DRAFT_260419 [Thermothelomyces heterothallicus CBS 202.75]|uniref:uncharacterized protein n=1 Tax=Thermothelomyces heterothallicus CBS 202.75 TaxID=1149848 RepID=UPI0037447E4B